jgi:hypothetical protein
MPQGKIVTIGTGSGLLEYPNAQATLKLDPGDTLMIAPGTYLGSVAGQPCRHPGGAHHRDQRSAHRLHLSRRAKRHLRQYLAFVHFEGFRIDKGSPWVFTGASHDLLLQEVRRHQGLLLPTPTTAERCSMAPRRAPSTISPGRTAAFGDSQGPFDGSAISSTDWSAGLEPQIGPARFRDLALHVHQHRLRHDLGWRRVSMDRCFNLKIHDCTFSNIGYSKFIVGHDAAIAGSGYFKVYNNTFSHHWANDVRMFPMKLNALGYDGKDAVSSYYNNISFEKRKYPIFEQNSISARTTSRNHPGTSRRRHRRSTSIRSTGHVAGP